MPGRGVVRQLAIGHGAQARACDAPITVSALWRYLMASSGLANWADAETETSEQLRQGQRNTDGAFMALGVWRRYRALPASCRPRRDLRRYLGAAALPGAAELAGHNPLGALSVLAMLAALGLQVGAGLFRTTNRAAFGRSSPRGCWRVPPGATRATTTLGAAGDRPGDPARGRDRLVPAAGRKLVRPMVSGDKALAEPVPAARDDARGPPRSSCWPWPAAWSMRWCNGATRRDWDRLRRIIRPARACLLHFSHAVDTRLPST
jgi:hypothetical protein